MVGVQFDGLLQTGDGLLVFLGLVESPSQGVASQGVSGVELDGPAALFDGLLELAFLKLSLTLCSQPGGGLDVALSRQGGLLSRRLGC